MLSQMATMFGHMENSESSETSETVPSFPSFPCAPMWQMENSEPKNSLLATPYFTPTPKHGQDYDNSIVTTRSS